MDLTIIGQQDFNKKLDEIRENLFIEKNTWWGHRYAGYSGTIVTNAKEVYYYEFYSLNLNGNKEKGTIKRLKDINDEEYNKILKFIDDEIVGKEFEPRRIFDAGFNVYINYNGEKRAVINYKGHENPDVYDKVDNLLKEIIKDH